MSWVGTLCGNAHYLVLYFSAILLPDIVEISRILTNIAQNIDRIRVEASKNADLYPCPLFIYASSSKAPKFKKLTLKSTQN